MTDFPRAKLAYLAAAFSPRPSSVYSAAPSTTSTQYASTTSSQRSSIAFAPPSTPTNSTTALNTAAVPSGAAPNTTATCADYEAFEHLHSTSYARSVRAMDGEAAYYDELDAYADRVFRRDVAKQLREMRRMKVEARNEKEGSRIRRAWRRVKFWLREAYLEPVLL